MGLGRELRDRIAVPKQGTLRQVSKRKFILSDGKGYEQVINVKRQVKFDRIAKGNRGLSWKYFRGAYAV